MTGKHGALQAKWQPLKGTVELLVPAQGQGVAQVRGIACRLYTAVKATGAQYKA